MHVDTLKDALAAEPFVPFVLRFGSGRTIEVANPGLVAVSSNGRSAYVFNPKGEGGSFVDVLLIEAIEFPPPPRRQRRAG
ncbi:MAG: hypothetical protein SFY69_02050 [Planctomycetota bacterium]|nr:hypothetical protein [Planctomycetota bacterium]